MRLRTGPFEERAPFGSCCADRPVQRADCAFALLDRARHSSVVCRNRQPHTIGDATRTFAPGLMAAALGCGGGRAGATRASKHVHLKGPASTTPPTDAAGAGTPVTGDHRKTRPRNQSSNPFKQDKQLKDDRLRAVLTKNRPGVFGRVDAIEEHRVGVNVRFSAEPNAARTRRLRHGDVRERVASGAAASLGSNQADGTS